LPTVLEAARRARRHGARVVLNPSPYSDLPSALLEAVDVLLMNEHEAAQFIGADAFAAATGSEALAERLNTFGIDAAVVTLG
ncbi:PfkB family carbohydrate kinase, partial [Campylobacter jejuni]|nr:PfkB family carbohydrate kinase [Campylobacter jejuni]